MPELITTDAGLERLIETAGDFDRLAVDTEFHREKTYFAQLALLQLAWPGGGALVDPLAVDPAPLGALFGGDRVVVMHAGDQDLEILERACGRVPATIFDTQLAAGFLGLSTPSLSALMSMALDLTLPKANRLTDWLRRPLSDDQLTYAAADVDHLLPLADLLEGHLAGCGRLEWVRAECEAVRLRARGPVPPEEAWRRIKECRSLTGATLALAVEVAAWREAEAQRRDVPVRRILPDLGVVTVAQRRPTDPRAIRQLRGIDGRLSNADAESLVAVVADAVASPKPPPPRGDRRATDRSDRPAIALLAAWLAQVARDLRLDPAILATRADIEAVVTEQDTDLRRGWRWELVGAPVEALLAGEAAVAFAPGGRLVLEERSGRTREVRLPVPTDLPW